MRWERDTEERNLDKPDDADRAMSKLFMRSTEKSFFPSPTAQSVAVYAVFMWRKEAVDNHTNYGQSIRLF